MEVDFFPFYPLHYSLPSRSSANLTARAKPELIIGYYYRYVIIIWSTVRLRYSFASRKNLLLKESVFMRFMMSVFCNWKLYISFIKFAHVITCKIGEATYPNTRVKEVCFFVLLDEKFYLPRWVTCGC